MDGLRISLFGHIQIAYQDGTVASLSPTTQLLAAYLILHRHRCHRRETLTERFWGESDEAHARGCLSSTLWRLRRVLEPEGIPHGTYLLTTPTGDGEIGFNTTSCYWLDIEAFEQYSHQIITQSEKLSPEQAEKLEQILHLYMGDLLEGIYDDWVLPERERLRQIYLDSLACLMHYHRRVQAYERSLAFGNQILSLEPLREDVQRAVIESYWASGQRALALRQYELCCEVLADELGIEPMEETQILYHQIVMNGSGYTAVFPQKTTISPPNMDQAMKQLSLAMQCLGQAQTQLQQAIKVMRRCVDSQQQHR